MGFSITYLSQSGAEGVRASARSFTLLLHQMVSISAVVHDVNTRTSFSVDTSTKLNAGLAEHITKASI